MDLTQNTIWGYIVRWVTTPLIMSMLGVLSMQLVDNFAHDDFFTTDVLCNAVS